MRYFVPSPWIGRNVKGKPGLVQVNPYEFFSRQIGTILKSPARARLNGKNGSWTRKAVVYNLFVRLTTAFDHDQDGSLNLPVNPDGFRETGTFLKTIALLPYIQEMGVNTIHLLPVTAIGHDGNKGRLGSPYAIRNPFRLDENLSEPHLNVGVEFEFKAFVEAAHYMGINVIAEFVLRTTSKDSDWVKEHPDWFYWIKESVPNRPRVSKDEHSYGTPIFSPETIKKIYDMVKRDDFKNTIPPSDSYRSIFTEPPLPGKVHMEEGRWIGLLPDGSRVKIPGAFPDWPLEDLQPPWDDVTYLKMYRNPQFNYLAYNTIRMYDKSLARKEHANSSLWKKIGDVIPHFQREFNIDGVMIDMGHALPLELFSKVVKTARKINPNFAFWEENFDSTKKSRDCGYNAAIGYVWSDQHYPDKMRRLFKRFSTETFPIPFFGTAESHNSPRAASFEGGTDYSRASWVMNNFFPVVPFIHSGFEFGETMPVNTGLNFTEADWKKYPSVDLPLFSEAALNWMNPEQLCSWIRKVVDVRKEFTELVVDPSSSGFEMLHNDNPNILTFKRGRSKKQIIVCANMSTVPEPAAGLPLPDGHNGIVDVFTKKKVKAVDGILMLSLKPWEVRVLKLGS